MTVYMYDRRSMSLTVKMLVSLHEGALQVGAQLGDRGLQIRTALLTQLLLHLQSAAREALRAHLQIGFYNTQSRRKILHKCSLNHYLYKPERRKTNLNAKMHKTGVGAVTGIHGMLHIKTKRDAGDNL